MKASVPPSLETRGSAELVIVVALFVGVFAWLMATKGYDEEHIVHPEHELTGQLLYPSVPGVDETVHWNSPNVQAWSLYLLKTKFPEYPVRYKHGLFEVEWKDGHWTRIACNNKGTMLYIGVEIEPPEFTSDLLRRYMLNQVNEMHPFKGGFNPLCR